MSEEGLIRLASICVPALVTIVTAYFQGRATKRHSAKQSILQMVMEDQLNWSLFKKLPTNYSDILHEYEEYHKNGGNGEVTRRVDDYLAWRDDIQKNMLKEVINGTNSTN